jgi:hypothetical protein
MRKPTRLLLSVSGALALLASVIVIGVWPAGAGVTGSFKVDCKFVKTAPDDPLVFPGKPGASHDHAFLGNLGISAYSTADSLSGVASSCAHNDRSAYWAPSLYQDGVKVNPSSMIVYYENRFAAGTDVEAFPPGFAMIFGNKNATTAAQVNDHISWGCSGNTQLGGKEPPASCPTGVIQVRFMWPYCWDGQVGGDASSHMSFAPGGVCSAKYPHRMPTIRTNLFYPVGTTTGTISFSSGNVYSIHQDFFNGWDPATLNDLITNCLNAGKACGHFTGTTSGAAAPAVPVPAGASAAPAPAALAQPASISADTIPTLDTAEVAGTDRASVDTASAPAVTGRPDPAAATDRLPRSLPGYLAAAATPGSAMFPVTVAALVLLFIATSAVLVIRRRRAAARVAERVRHY